MGPELRKVADTIMSDLGMGEDQDKIDALVSSSDLHLLMAPSIIKHQAMIKARSRQRHRLFVISGTAVQPYRYSSALHARGGRG